MSRNHKIIFPKLTFTSEGEYLYTIKELTPPGEIWKTDGRVFRVIVTVTENSQGNLVAKLSYPDGFPEFVNIYCDKHPPKPKCDPCKHFNRLPFPMYWFSPPQKAEFAELTKKFPRMFESDWWQTLFESLRED
ncbi:MAG: hypothetical protein FWB98_05530 [Defluviitaleaceae bacterium]|nr:hypothetical protein [Defluviitaleaceae bacterium]